MMGQLASALAHEINQPLGAILRNAEAAELYMQSETPDLEEIRAILADIRADDQRAGNVIRIADDRDGDFCLLQAGLEIQHQVELGHLVVRDYSPSLAILALYDRPRLNTLNVLMTVISLEVRMAGANRSAQEGRRATPIHLVK
jgi:hypothetical protein